MRFFLVACLCTAPAAAVSAQHPVAGIPPTRVGVVRTAPNPAVIPEANRRLLDRSIAHRRSLAGGVAGFVVGAAAGAFVGCLANRDDYGVLCGGQSDTRVFVGAAIGATAGALIGSRL